MPFPHFPAQSSELPPPGMYGFLQPLPWLFQLPPFPRAISPASGIYQHRLSSNNRDIYVTDLLAWNNFDYSKELQNVETKVLLMRGEDDPVVTENMLEDTVKIMRNSTKQTLTGLGHYPMLEDPENLAKIIGYK